MSKLDDFIAKNEKYLDKHGNDDLSGQIVAGLQELAKAVKEEISEIKEPSHATK